MLMIIQMSQMIILLIISKIVWNEKTKSNISYIKKIIREQKYYFGIKMFPNFFIEFRELYAIIKVIKFPKRKVI